MAGWPPSKRVFNVISWTITELLIKSQFWAFLLKIAFKIMFNSLSINNELFVRFIILKLYVSIWWYTCITYGPLHRDFNFPGNNLSLELNSRTFCPGSKTLDDNFLSCHLFAFSLYIFASLKALSLNSSSSFNWSNRFSLANLASRFRNLVA